MVSRIVITVAKFSEGLASYLKLTLALGTAGSKSKTGE